MSLRAPSLLFLVTYLQRQGLTYAHLREWATLCQERHSGQVTFELTEGRIRTVHATPSGTRRPQLVHD